MENTTENAHLLSRPSSSSSRSSTSSLEDLGNENYLSSTRLTRYPKAEHPAHSPNPFQAAPSYDTENDTEDETNSDHEITERQFRDRDLAEIFQSPTKATRSRTICLLMVIGSAVAIWIVISIVGFFAFQKYKQPPLTGKSPPWYPTPRGGTAKTWQQSYKKAQEMVSKMTLAEKVNVTTGTGWSMGLAVGNTAPAIGVGFPQLALQDGPLGIRFTDNATAFPAGITAGATWSRELMYARGKAHGLEARLKGINVLLSPCVGPLGKVPAGGRNWEGFGADPYLQGISGAETIKGIQSEHVMAVVKHFVGNEQEHFRQSYEWGLPNALSSNIDERTLRELYAWPFLDAIKAGVAGIMCSYNMINNSYACGNSKLMSGILKDEMGFQGFVVSDWLAQRSGVASALAGLDMTMPGDGLGWMDGKSLWGSELTKAVLNGSVPMERMNDMVTRVIAAWYQLGQDNTTLFDRKGPNFSSWTDKKMGILAPGSSTPQETVEVNKFVDAQRDHKVLAREIAAEGTVLLMNDGILPLRRDGSYGSKSKIGKRHGGIVKIGIFGEDAGPGNGPNFCPDRGCNTGTLGSGWGSGAVNFPFLVTPIEALKRRFSDNVEITESLSNSVDLDLLTNQDICIVFGNADGGEGFISFGGIRGDRNDLFLQQGADRLVRDVIRGCGKSQGKTIVVIHAIGPVVMERWIEEPGLSAILFANLPGEESGDALVDILFGDVNPSGKLPFTIGKDMADYGPGGQVMYLPNSVVPQIDFDEGVFVDYRWFDKRGIEPRFDFGFGLSYTTFEFSGLAVERVKEKSEWPAERPEGVEAPKYPEDIPDVREGLAPEGFVKMEKYIYPYIKSPDDIQKGAYPYPEGYHKKQPVSPVGGDEGGNPDLWTVHARITVNVKNTGIAVGKAVAQLYVEYPEVKGVEFPVRVLRGFHKVSVEPGKTEKVTFELTRRDLSWWDVGKGCWRMATEGSYGIGIGGSSRQIVVKGVY